MGGERDHSRRCPQGLEAVVSVECIITTRGRPRVSTCAAGIRPCRRPRDIAKRAASQSTLGAHGFCACARCPCTRMRANFAFSGLRGRVSVACELQRVRGGQRGGLSVAFRPLWQRLPAGHLLVGCKSECGWVACMYLCLLTELPAAPVPRLFPLGQSAAIFLART